MALFTSKNERKIKLDNKIGKNEQAERIIKKDNTEIGIKKES